jgi:ribosomal protein S18 acetylase RimI-like enzyme
MTAVSELITNPTQAAHIRPFDPRRDLNRVADLVELCFAETLDQEGRSYLRHMRHAARNPGYFSMVSLRARIPLSGFVWEDDGRLVGNLTLIPYVSLRHSYYLIANVAVHPNYRRQGIARGLTLSALEHLRRRGAHAAWLHVRGENNAATELYHTLGFVERASRTTWHSAPEAEDGKAAHPGGMHTGGADMAVNVLARRARDWPVQRIWLKRLYPSVIAWQLPLRIPAIQPGVWGFFYRMFNDLHLRQWSAWRDGRLIGVVAWQSSPGYTDHLWLALDPDGDETAVAPLLSTVRRRSSPRRTLSLDYPSGKAAHEIQLAGFSEHQNLIWMALDLTSNA